jgi:hypothetical protein
VVGNPEDKINNYFDGKKIWKEEKPKFRLRGLKEIYFANDVKYGEGYRKQGSLQTIYSLGAIALLSPGIYRKKDVFKEKLLSHPDTLLLLFYYFPGWSAKYRIIFEAASRSLDMG